MNLYSFKKFPFIAVAFLFIVSIVISQETFQGVKIQGIHTQYNPLTDVPNLVGFYSFNSQMTIDTTGTNTVAQWNDQVGTRHFIIGTKPNQPTLLTNAVNGHVALSFDGVANHLTNGSTASFFTGLNTPQAGWMIVRPEQSSNTGFICFGNGTIASTSATNSQYLLKAFQASASFRSTRVDDTNLTVNVSETGVVSNAWNFYAWSFSGTRLTVCVNGVFQENAMSVGTMTVNTASIGAFFRGGSFASHTQHDIAEWGICNANISTNVIRSLYLNRAKPIFGVP